MADTTLTINTIIPLGLSLDGTYAYIAGNTNSGKTQRVEKYNVASWPWTLVDSANHYVSGTNATYYSCRYSSGYLYCAGLYRDAGAGYHSVVRKVDATNLATISWTYDQYTTSDSSNFLDAMVGSDGYIYACGGRAGAGQTARITAAGANSWYVTGIYSNCYNCIGDYGTSFDFIGSYGGYRNIYRFTKSSGAYSLACGSPGSIGFYQFYTALQNSESGTMYYYIVGRYDATINYPQESLWKGTQANPAATTWERTYDKWVNPNTTYEDMRGVCTDGTYFYCQGFYYANGTSTNPTQTLSCWNTAGTARWATITSPANRLMFVNSIQNIAGSDYFFNVNYDYTNVTGANGYLEMRKKADGLLADSSVFAESYKFPVCFFRV